MVISPAATEAPAITAVDVPLLGSSVTTGVMAVAPALLWLGLVAVELAAGAVLVDSTGREVEVGATELSKGLAFWFASFWQSPPPVQE